MNIETGKRDIGHVIDDALTALRLGKLHMALRSIFAALDETAQAAYPGKQVGDRITMFVGDNTTLIYAGTLLGTKPPVKIGRMKFELLHPEIADDKGLASLQDIIYYLMRCMLTHTTDIDEMIEFSNDAGFACHNGKKLTLPTTLPIGLIVAIVASPVNAGKQAPPCHITAFGVTMNINELWGREDLWRQRLEQVHEGLLRQNEADKEMRPPYEPIQIDFRY